MDRLGLDYHCVVVGTGRLTGRLRRLTEPWCARGVVSVMSPLPPDRLYAEVYPRLDACLLFSPAEGLPNLPMEALVHGVVPVVSDYLGRAEQGLVRDGETGLVFPVGDMKAAAMCINRLANEPGLVNRLTEAGRREVAEGYSLERMASGWADALQHAVEGEPAAGDVSAKPLPPAGRLDGWLGEYGAEGLRRLLGRRYHHPDASEWPHAGDWSAATLDEMRHLVDDEARLPARPFSSAG
jgi:hypothetical protein